LPPDGVGPDRPENTEQSTDEQKRRESGAVYRNELGDTGGGVGSEGDALDAGVEADHRTDDAGAGGVHVRLGGVFAVRDADGRRTKQLFLARS